MVSMLVFHCPECVALFAEMRSAVNEADATTKLQEA
jgi:hypothetical protein